MEENKNDIAPETEEVVNSCNVEAAEVEDTAADDLQGEALGDRVKTLSPGRTVLKRFFRSKLSVIGLTVIIALFLISFIGPLFSPWGEQEPDTTRKMTLITQEIKYYIDGEQYTAYSLAYQETDNIYADPSWNHLLGTDERGLDIFTRLMYGGRVSLTIGFLVVIVETLLGVVLGGLAGYFGGKVDNVIMRITDILYCIPQLPLMLIFSAVFNGLEITSIIRLYYMMGILTLIGWAGVARLVRGQILSLREQEFMLAAKCSGLSVGRKIFKHLIPNVMPQLIVSMTLGLGSIILTEATLGFLGIGAPPGTATWGAMIQTANDAYNLSFLPNFWVPPGICITLAILAFNFVGDGLRDAFDPKMKR
ncbi:MAG: ABC transporter permease [Clostridia bacterium]|nr:ABC transporter permease [Clostridia bacterium]